MIDERNGLALPSFKMWDDVLEEGIRGKTAINFGNCILVGCDSTFYFRTHSIYIVLSVNELTLLGFLFFGLLGHVMIDESYIFMDNISESTAATRNSFDSFDSEISIIPRKSTLSSFFSGKSEAVSKLGTTACPSICLSVFVSVHLYVCVCVCLFVCLYVCLSI